MGRWRLPLTAISLFSSISCRTCARQAVQGCHEINLGTRRARVRRDCHVVARPRRNMSAPEHGTENRVDVFLRRYRTWRGEQLEWWSEAPPQRTEWGDISSAYAAAILVEQSATLTHAVAQVARTQVCRARLRKKVGHNCASLTCRTLVWTGTPPQRMEKEKVGRMRRKIAHLGRNRPDSGGV